MKRKLFQLYSALLFNANFKGFSSGSIYKGNTKKLCVPGINCYSCPGAVAACPLGSLQGAFDSNKSTLYYVGGILLLYGILFGRMICGWFCPFGLIQELLYKAKTPKVKKNKVTKILSYLKYIILLVFVFLIPILYALRNIPLPAFCKYICPAGTLEGGLMLLANKVNAGYFSMLGPLFTWKFLILLSILVGSIFIFRLFCRFICPLGALYGLFNKLSFFGIKIEPSKCINCNRCISKCKMDIHHVGDAECISCGECIKVCPTDAILWKGTKLTTQQNNKLQMLTRSISATILLALLIGAILFYWNDDSGITIPSIDSTQAEYGTDIGDLCYGSDLTRIDETGILEKTIDPTKTGKLTIINFWGTWCNPCVNELPYFDQIASEYKEEVAVIAIHTNLGIDKAADYILKYYPDSDILFAKDEGENFSEIYYTLLGGRDTYPYTVVIDENGVIVKIFLSSVEYEDLKELVE